MSSLRFRLSIRYHWLGVILILLVLAMLLLNFDVNSQPPQAKQTGSHAVILMYHHFGEDHLPSTSVRLAQLDAQIQYLADENFTVWPLSKLVTALIEKAPIPEKTVVFTIDDAWKSVYLEAFPRFKARGWPLTVFVSTDQIDRRYSSNMTWAQMREMQQFGAEFANHSRHHNSMIQTEHESYADWRQRVLTDLNHAQKRLEAELGQTPTNFKLFSYPFGDFSEPLANLITEMGYIGIAQNSGTVGHDSDLRALMRFPINERHGEIESFKTKVHTLPLPVQQLSPFDPVVKNNPPQLTLTFEDPPTQTIQCFDQAGTPLTLTWLSNKQLQLQSVEPLAPPRNRYACTQQTQSGQWRWMSHSWVIPASSVK
ncbi:MAG: hypothetical protein CO158_03770 [Piscirickettsiaceae bacterium CG_4_9_14_3_um_filter_43_564]|nr:polysaccharide deacetylase family protein [Thiomicrospira sp.]OIP95936.1 MAG: hypothetical protein AUK56_03685 [Thiomicrospira sp. CG2_30_44_34]PIQ02506.1 MAG: hypothetical protein COW74_11335 [Piscirickettsiaceae bacterium CG18_big_fil_WC_8_21_14_2_50_44_103]PIU37644.1 MAG: hypothetical protein COT01_10790 [Piscirickettsiaceae bacterium CG07_land_8_20_14_0_80_44_28]PIW57997.1 MAG: hypothetical protein COW14_03090 [Piscirickettsiaceae bacterium CG12_big_fil_rev_8_21_14_0_65_44_934]PIW76713.